MLSLNLLAARAHRAELLACERRSRDDGATPVSRVTLRHSSVADRPALEQLAEMDSAPAPHGTALVAEVDGRLRAALPLDGGQAISDPFHQGRELLELLHVRASQLGRIRRRRSQPA